jgi:hypothetical protein
MIIHFPQGACILARKKCPVFIVEMTRDDKLLEA